MQRVTETQLYAFQVLVSVICPANPVFPLLAYGFKRFWMPVISVKMDACHTSANFSQCTEMCFVTGEDCGLPRIAV